MILFKVHFLLSGLYLFLIISVRFWLSSSIKVFYFGFPPYTAKEEDGVVLLRKNKVPSTRDVKEGVTLDVIHVN